MRLTFHDAVSRHPLRHMRRAGLAGLRLLPVALLAFAVFAWAWSYRTWMTVDWFPRGRKADFGLSWVRGSIVCRYTHVEPPLGSMDGSGLVWDPTPSSRFDSAAAAAGWGTMDVRFKCGLFIYASLRFPSFACYALQIPFWVVALALSLYPLFTVFRWRARRRRVNKGCCVKCGYDLRASEGVCPECGTPIARGIRASPDASRGAHPSAPG